MQPTYNTFIPFRHKIGLKARLFPWWLHFMKPRVTSLKQGPKAHGRVLIEIRGFTSARRVGYHARLTDNAYLESYFTSLYGFIKLP